MEVFVADTVAIDPALIERLDEIRQANRGAPALPVLLATACDLRSGTLPLEMS